MAAYNAARFIGAALRSVQEQSLRDWEAIVVDDRSADDTCEIVAGVAAADPRVRLVRQQVNNGPADARNQALALASGEWFAVLDSDDAFAPDRLERLVAAAEARGADIIADNPVVFADDGSSPERLHLADEPRGRWIDLPDYLDQTQMFGGGLEYGYLKPMIRLDRLREEGLAYDPALRIGEDDDLVVRMLLAGLSYRLEPLPTYRYRRHASSTSFRLSPANAKALVTASTALAAVHARHPCGRLLKQRRRAFERALAFVSFIAALKQRRPGAALGIILRRPKLIPLLQMPLGAAMARWRRD